MITTGVPLSAARRRSNAGTPPSSSAADCACSAASGAGAPASCSLAACRSNGGAVLARVVAVVPARLRQPDHQHGGQDRDAEEPGEGALHAPYGGRKRVREWTPPRVLLQLWDSRSTDPRGPRVAPRRPGLGSSARGFAGPLTSPGAAPTPLSPTEPALAEPTSVAVEAAPAIPVPTDDAIERAAAFTREPFLLEGEVGRGGALARLGAPPCARRRAGRAGRGREGPVGRLAPALVAPARASTGCSARTSRSSSTARSSPPTRSTRSPAR